MMLFGMCSIVLIIALGLSVSSDEAIWFSGPAFCEGICVSSPPGAAPVPLIPGFNDSVNVGDYSGDIIAGFDVSPDGDHIAFMRTTAWWSHFDVWIANSDGRNPRALSQQVREYCEYSDSGKRCSSTTPYFGQAIEWSPDGEGILYANVESGITLIDREGRAIRERFPISPWDILSTFHWSPEGYIAYSFRTEYSEEGGIMASLRIVDDDDGSIVHEFELPGFGWDPRISPDGLSLSYYQEQPDSIFVIDIASGQRRFITNGIKHAWSPDSQQIVYLRHEEDEPATIQMVDLNGGNSTVIVEYTPDDFRELRTLLDIEWLSSVRETSISPMSWGTVKRRQAR